jgi:CRP-like cAMP-binding protein
MPERTLPSIAFPVLDQEQIARVASCTSVVLKLYRDGETLIAVGERAFKFFIVKSGQIEVLDFSSDQTKTIAILPPTHYTRLRFRYEIPKTSTVGIVLATDGA